MKNILSKLKTDSVKKLQVCYDDYSGRLCGKIVPENKFESVFKNGVVFAKANLSFGLDDHFAENAKFLANTVQFLFYVVRLHSFLDQVMQESPRC